MRVFHKFKAVRCEADGIKFPSKKERDYYLYLKSKQDSGELLFFLDQVKFRLPGNTKYILDFIEFWKVEDDPDSARVVFTEVKGLKLAMGQLKIKQCQDLYPIEINIV